MSEYYKGITFADQNASPIDDAVIRRMLLSDGVLVGCDLSYAGYTLTMASGYLIACGRQIRHPTAENWAITDASSGYARVLMTIDMTRTSTEEVFDQVNTSIEYATSKDGFPALIQDDINATGSQYQVALAVVSLGTGGITGIVSKLELAESSGGGGLNFSVVGGTTQPSSPKENTIWVNTDIAITGWVFSAAEPENPSEGMVWIATGTTSTVEINALKKNGIWIYPFAVKQYSAGIWNVKTAKSYMTGEWTALWDGYLFKSGDECTAITGGWDKMTGNGTVEKNDNSITLTAWNYPTNSDVTCATNNKIDITGYSTLHITCSNIIGSANRLFLLVSTDKTRLYDSAVAKIGISAYNTSLDISGIAGGTYYIGVFAFMAESGTSSVTFTSVMLD